MTDWLQNSVLARALAGSVTTFAAVQALHLLSIALVGGVALVSNLTQLGFIGGGAAPGSTTHGLRTLWRGALAAAALTGLLLFATSPQKYLGNALFTVKLSLLAAALATGATVVRRGAGNSGDGPARILAAVSILLWLGVITAGRWIGLI